jgi:hypothetical protein
MVSALHFPLGVLPLKSLHYLTLAVLGTVGAATGGAADPPKPDPKVASAKAEVRHEIPYRLTDTKHVLVRAKLNGQGPFNFILDTGAPAVFIPKKVATKVGLETDAKGWGVFKTFEIEGGLKVEKAKSRVEDLFQLEGMNGMGLAGVELHGVIGYNVLAQYRITYDFTADKLIWAKLSYDPPDPVGIGGKGGQGGLEMMGTMMKTLAAFMGIKPNFEVRPTGFLGAELEEKTDGVYIKSLLKGGPADDAKVQVGDKIEAVAGSSIDDLADLRRALNKNKIDEAIKFTVQRKGESLKLTLTLGKGF